MAETTERVTQEGVGPLEMGLGASEQAVNEEVGQLKRRALTLLDVMVMSITFAGPTVSIFFNSAPGVSFSGAALPLSFVIATIGILFLANSVIQFSKKLPTAGFAYTFNSHGLGPRAGLISGWLLLFGYALTTPMIYSAFALWSHDVLHQAFGWEISWTVFFVLAVLFVVGLSLLGIRESMRADIVLMVFEVGAVLALSIFILAKGGHNGHGITASPLTPLAPGAAWSGIFLAMIYTVMSYTGFETSATLGEETRKPRVNIPRATLFSILFLGAFYVFTSYAETVGFGTSHMAALMKQEIPFNALAITFWGNNWSYLISVAAITALLSGLIASHNATVRILFSMGRGRSFPSMFGSTLPRFQTPGTAIIAHAIFSLVLGMGLGLWVGPANVWAYLGAFMVPALIIVYVLVNISVILYYRREHLSEFSIWKHGVFPVLGTAVLFLPLKSVVYPVPPAPYSWVPYVVTAWIILGFVWIYLISRNRPDALEQAGRVWTED